MRATSLTGKQVSTDSSKVIGEEARARLQGWQVDKCRISTRKETESMKKQEYKTGGEEARARFAFWEGAVCDSKLDQLINEERWKSANIRLEVDYCRGHLVPGRRSRYRQSLKLLRSETEMTPWKESWRTFVESQKVLSTLSPFTFNNQSCDNKDSRGKNEKNQDRESHSSSQRRPLCLFFIL